MATPPVISAPTLVTSTNLAATPPHSHQAREEDNFWHSKYLEAKVNYRKLKSQMREQAKKSRLLIVAVKNILEQEELKMAKMKEAHDMELSNLSQQLTTLQASMLREQLRVESLLREKDQLISKQKLDLEKLSASAPVLSSSNVSVTPVAPLGGSIRIHGSFRQYKKDREKSRHHSSKTTLISDSSSISSGINVNSSEESSSSPSTLPRAHSKSVLRQTVSTSLVESETASAPTALKLFKKSILKATSSVDSPGSSTQSILDNLQQLIESNKTKILISTSQVDLERSDSGRESDEQSNPNVSVVTVSTDSANSSFDAADPGVKINITTTARKEPPPLPAKPTTTKKAKPPPPPRSSQTKLSTVPPASKPTKSILSPTSSLTMELSPTEALDNLIRNVDNTTNKLRHSEKKKRVKFNPKVDTNDDSLFLSISPAKPLDPNFLHFLPRLSTKQQQDHVDKIILDPGHSSNNKNNFSYYEPYI